MFTNDIPPRPQTDPEPKNPAVILRFPLGEPIELPAPAQSDLYDAFPGGCESLNEPGCGGGRL